jgi:hypothetical protein
LVPSSGQVSCSPASDRAAGAFLSFGTGFLIVSKIRTDHTVELVARAIYEAEQHACSWDNGSAMSRERSREYARNAIRLLNNDIGVLLSALNEAAAEQSSSGLRAVS